MGTRSTFKTRKSRRSPSPGSPSRGSDITRAPARAKCEFRATSSLRHELADPLAPAVLDRDDLELVRLKSEPREECMRGRSERATVAVLGLERDSDPVARGAKEPFRSALGDPAGKRLHQLRVGCLWAADQIGMGTHR